MRRLLAMGMVVFALSIGATSSVFAATSTGRQAAVAHPAAAVTSLRWTAPFNHKTLSGKATLVITRTYSSGHASVSVTGVKKGDTVLAYITFRTTKGKSGTLVRVMHVVTGSKGKTSFSFSLSSKVRSEIKADLKAGDTLRIRIADKTAAAIGAFTKV